MDSDYYEAKQDAMSDFLAEYSENCEDSLDYFLNMLIYLNFDFSNFQKKYIFFLKKELDEIIESE